MPYLESIILGISIAAIPGPIFFELIRRTLTRGFWSGSLLAVGEFLANISILLLTFYGLNQFLSLIWIKALLFLVGGGLLIYVGVSSFKMKEKDMEISSKKKVSQSNSIFAGFGIGISSPLAIAVWISVGGTYLAKYTIQTIALTNMFLMAFGVLLFFFTLASVIYLIKDKIKAKYLVALSKLFGAALVVYGMFAIWELAKLIVV
jgi:threonine/homoserine/homoserine lactone efflux protein